MPRTVSSGSAWPLPLVLLLALGTAPAIGQHGTKNGEWRAYAGDPGSTKYSPLDQINKDNAKNLRIAWRFKTDNLGVRPDYNMQATPVMVNGVLYTAAGTRRDVVAIDPATGEMLWMWRMDEGKRGTVAPRQGSGRGVGYWTDGKGDERRWAPARTRCLELSLISFADEDAALTRKGADQGPRRSVMLTARRLSNASYRPFSRLAVRM